jgi:hypothetical protein
MYAPNPKHPSLVMFHWLANTQDGIAEALQRHMTNIHIMPIHPFTYIQLWTHPRTHQELYLRLVIEGIGESAFWLWNSTDKAHRETGRVLMEVGERDRGELARCSKERGRIFLDFLSLACYDRDIQRHTGARKVTWNSRSDIC